MFFFLVLWPPLKSTLFPYTTLFRSCSRARRGTRRPRRTARRRSAPRRRRDRKSTRLNSSHPSISYAVFCLKKKLVQPVRSQRQVAAHANQQGADCSAERPMIGHETK